jgi:hypothetical protein
MSWIRKSPFGRDEDPAKHMLALLAKEAERAGVPLSEEEQEILASRTFVPLELDSKARDIIDQMPEKERVAGPDRDPKSFGNSLEWADCDNGSNVVELTIAVASDKRAMYPPPIQWGLWFKDKIGLVGSAFAVVILLMLFAGALSFLFDHK